MTQNESFPAKTDFLTLAPPHWAARGLAWTIIVVVLLGALASVVVKLPEVVTAQFTLVPVRGADPLKAPREGIIERVYAEEGGTIKQGEIVATLRSEAVGDRLADLQTVQTQLAGAGASVGNARLQFETELRAAEQEQRKLEIRAQHLTEQIEQKRRQLALTVQMAESFETLFREGIASRAQLAAKQIEVSELTAEVARLVAEQRETRAAVDKLKLDAAARHTAFKESERKFKETVATNEIKAAALQASLADSAGNEVNLSAPCTGTILRLHAKNGGAVVHAGDTVAELVCTGAPLQAELTVPQTGLGKLKPSQGVKLKYDAFPYQRFGVKYGRLTWLSPAGVETKSGEAFKARVELADKEIAMAGQLKTLVPGMGGTAEIVIGKRSLLSYVFEPLRQLKENFSDVPPQVSQVNSER